MRGMVWDVTLLSDYGSQFLLYTSGGLDDGSKAGTA